MYSNLQKVAVKSMVKFDLDLSWIDQDLHVALGKRTTPGVKFVWDFRWKWHTSPPLTLTCVSSFLQFKVRKRSK